MAAIRQSKGDRIFDAVNLTLMTLLMLIVLYPLVYILSASISNPDLVNRGEIWLLPKGITFEGYIRVFQDNEIMIGYRNTIFYTVAGTIVNLFFTLTAAYALSKRELKGRSIFMFFFAFTMYFSGGMVPTYLLMRNLNLINTYFVLIICGAVSTSNLIISRTFFANGVPQDIEEAAFIDGCSPIRAFIVIVLPLSKALIGVMALYYGVGQWNAYFNAMIYLTDAELYPLQLVLRGILLTTEATLESGSDPETLMAQQRLGEVIKYGVIVVSALPAMIAYPFVQKNFVKGVMIGSLKG